MIQHKLTIMRDKRTGSKDFRELLKEISLLMGYEVTRDIPLEDVEIETPLCKMMAKEVSGRKLAIVPILRAGMGMVEGLQTLVPVAKVGHIGLYRNEETHNPVVYYCKLPEDIQGGDQAGPGRPPGRGHLRRGGGRPPQRKRLHRPGSGRCRRPHFRHEVAPISLR